MNGRTLPWVGYFVPLETIWRRHRGNVAVTRARFDEYFASRPRGYAVLLGDFEPLGPITSAKVGKIIAGFARRAGSTWMRTRSPR